MAHMSWSEVQAGDMVTAVARDGTYTHHLEGTVLHVVSGAVIVTGMIQIIGVDEQGLEIIVTRIPLLEAPIYVFSPDGSDSYWSLLADYSPATGEGVLA